MTGCEIIAYLNGKTYLVKFRHDGMDIPNKYFVESPVDFTNDPEKELIKMMEWWLLSQTHPGDDLDENNKKFVWIRECVWNRRKENAESFHSRAVDEYCNPSIDDENILGCGYQCGYGCYGVLIDFEKKKVTSFGGDRTNHIQSAKGVNRKVIAEYNRRNKC